MLDKKIDLKEKIRELQERKYELYKTLNDKFPYNLSLEGGYNFKLEDIKFIMDTKSENEEEELDEKMYEEQLRYEEFSKEDEEDEYEREYYEELQYEEQLKYEEFAKEDEEDEYEREYYEELQYEEQLENEELTQKEKGEYLDFANEYARAKLYLKEFILLEEIVRKHYNKSKNKVIEEVVRKHYNKSENKGIEEIIKNIRIEDSEYKKSKIKYKLIDCLTSVRKNEEENDILYVFEAEKERYEIFIEVVEACNYCMDKNDYDEIQDMYQELNYFKEKIEKIVIDGESKYKPKSYKFYEELLEVLENIFEENDSINNYDETANLKSLMYNELFEFLDKRNYHPKKNNYRKEGKRKKSKEKKKKLILEYHGEGLSISEIIKKLKEEGKEYEVKSRGYVSDIINGKK